MLYCVGSYVICLHGFLIKNATHRQLGMNVQTYSTYGTSLVIIAITHLCTRSQRSVVVNWLSNFCLLNSWLMDFLYTHETLSFIHVFFISMKEEFIRRNKESARTVMLNMCMQKKIMRQRGFNCIFVNVLVVFYFLKNVDFKFHSKFKFILCKV